MVRINTNQDKEKWENGFYSNAYISIYNDRSLWYILNWIITWNQLSNLLLAWKHVTINKIAKRSTVKLISVTAECKKVKALMEKNLYEAHWSSCGIFDGYISLKTFTLLISLMGGQIGASSFLHFLRIICLKRDRVDLAVRNGC